MGTIILLVSPIKINNNMLCGQYFYLLLAVFFVNKLGAYSDHGISGYFIYLFLGSLSALAIVVFISISKGIVSLILCFIELLAILLQLISCYSSLTKNSSNWFYQNFESILEWMYYSEIGLIIMVGIYGTGLLAWNYYLNLHNNRGSTGIDRLDFFYNKSLHRERRKENLYRFVERRKGEGHCL